MRRPTRTGDIARFPLTGAERRRVRRAFGVPERAPRKRIGWKTLAVAWSLATVGGVAVGAQMAGWPATPDNASASSGRASGEWRRSFGACKWGGGTDCVVDGDTLYLGGTKIRVADIDAPETHDYRCPEERELGERAAERLRQLVNSGPVELAPIGRDEDRYGRKLRVVKVGGTSVGDTLVREGLARPYAGGRRPWCA